MAQNENDDLFGRPTRGAFPKVEDFDGRLLLFMPSKIEYGIKGKFGEQDRVTTDVVVLDDPSGEIEKVDDMFISQKGLVSTLAKCLKPGNKPFVLGRMSMFPAKDTQEAAEKHPDGIRGVLEDWLRKGGKGNKPPFSWGLADFTDEDAAKARAYIAANDSFSRG